MARTGSGEHADLAVELVRLDQALRLVPALRLDLTRELAKRISADRARRLVEPLRELVAVVFDMAPDLVKGTPSRVDPGAS